MDTRDVTDTTAEIVPKIEIPDVDVEDDSCGHNNHEIIHDLSEVPKGNQRSSCTKCI